MSWIQFILYSILLVGTYHYSLSLSTTSKKEHSLLTDTTSTNNLNVLQGILNQDSLVRFSMVQKIQNLVMDVVDIKSNDALFAENVKTMLSEIWALNAENQKNRQDISEMKKELAKCKEDVKQLNTSQENNSRKLLVFQKDNQNVFHVVNQTFLNLWNTQSTQDISLRNVKEQLESLTNILGNATEDILALKAENQNQTEEIAEMKKENKGQKMKITVVTGANCADILKKDPSIKDHDGVYTINPDNTSPKKVFCDMTTNGGGWTVVQNRIDGSTDFYRTWNDYKEGFGNSANNYWIGNDMIHILTRNKTQKLRVELQRFSGEKGYAEYSTFAVGDETSKYKLAVSGFSGNIRDSLNYHNAMKFSTWDQDNDGNSVSCSQSYHGAWWYKSCYYSNLNGKYMNSSISSDNKSNNWYHWQNSHESLKTTRMMIRP